MPNLETWSLQAGHVYYYYYYIEFEMDKKYTKMNSSIEPGER